MMTLSNSDDVPSGDGFLQKGTLEPKNKNKERRYLLFHYTIIMVTCGHHGSEHEEEHAEEKHCRVVVNLRRLVS